MQNPFFPLMANLLIIRPAIVVFILIITLQAFNDNSFQNDLNIRSPSGYGTDQVYKRMVFV
mgnify:CR=1 FL=1|jgi:hypothetical protein